MGYNYGEEPRQWPNDQRYYNLLFNIISLPKGIVWWVLGGRLRGWYNFFWAAHTLERIYTAPTLEIATGCVFWGAVTYYLTG